LARILVLDGHSAAALAFTRSAGRAGHWVAVGANAGIFAAAKRSRFCNLAFDYPVSTRDAQSFVEAILQFVRENAIELVVPITDWTLQPLSDARDQFAQLCRVALPPPAAVANASDKYRTIEIAKNLGVAVPLTWLVRTLDELSGLSELGFPVVVKDRFSVRWAQGKAAFGTVAYALGKEDLERKVGERLQKAGDVLIQKFVPGVGIGFSCFVTKDDVRLPFGWERVREADPRGSASSCRKSIELDEPMVSLSSRLIREIGFEGIAMVEYKRAGDGPPVLMEINGRPWGSIALPIASGIDYPRYLLDWCLTGTLPPERIAYRNGTTCRRVVGELTHLSNLRRGKPPYWPGAYPRLWSSLVKIAVPWYPGMHYDDLWLSDWRPGVAEIEHWFRVRLKK
jgi:predicted ATP-grasp superfamily ATP-dependent carboligase